MVRGSTSELTCGPHWLHPVRGTRSKETKPESRSPLNAPPGRSGRVTACEFAGAELPEGTDSISMVPTLTGSGEQKLHDYLYREFYKQGGQQAVRAGDWKGIRLNVGRNPGSRIRLYKLARDPGETDNVADRYPDEVVQLTEMMTEAHTPSEIVEFKPAQRPGRRKARTKRIEDGRVLEREGWTVLFVSSESRHNGRLIGTILDDDESTFWHSRWQGDVAQPPHEFVIDPGSSEKITGVRLLPRQDGQENGRVDDFEVYVSETEEFGEPVASGEFSNTNMEQRAAIPPVSGRYVKVVIRSEVNGEPFASISEFNLETD